MFAKYTGDAESTQAASFSIKRCKVGAVSINLGCWDTAGDVSSVVTCFLYMYSSSGQEKFEAITSYYCRGALGAIICYGDVMGIIVYQSFCGS